MTDSKTILDRVLRIEQRIGATVSDHACVWLARPGETNEQASERARLAGFSSIGLLVPADTSDVDEWEREATAHARAQQQRGNE